MAASVRKGSWEEKHVSDMARSASEIQSAYIYTHTRAKIQEYYVKKYPISNINALYLPNF